MPKKNLTVLTKNRTPSGLIAKFRRVFKKHLWLSIICSALLLWGLVWLGQVAVERYNFTQAEKKLDSLASEIQAILQTDMNLSKEKICSYSSRKFSRGERSCSISYGAELSPASASKSSEISKKIKYIIESSKAFPHKKVDKDNLPFKDIRTAHGTSDQHYAVDLTLNDTEPSCYLSSDYIIYSPTSKQIPHIENSFSISFSCYGSAKVEYFPVSDH